MLIVICFLICIINIAGCKIGDKTIKSSPADTEVDRENENFQLYSELEIASEKCISLCLELKSAGADFSAGPCLSNNIIEGWVCDVAHSPRQDIDNLKSNMCEAFVNGTAKRFIEVDKNCNLIKTY